MARRFKNLDYALKLLRTPTGTGTPPSAPAGSILKEYQDYASGAKAITYTRTEDSKPEAILKISVLPFFFGGVDGSEAIVSQSKRSDDNSALSGIQTACNQKAVDLDTHKTLRGFIPAKATVFDFTGGTTTPNSKITGVKYTKRTGKSYTFPYGASAAEKAEGNVRKDILTAVTAVATASVSFTSEKY